MSITIQQLKTKRIALVLSGGGARGAYQIGVWKAMKEIGIPIHIVTGISVGALNGAFVAQDDLMQAEKMWNNVATADVLDFESSEDLTTLSGYTKNLTTLIYQALKQRGISSKPMKQLVDYYLADEETLKNMSVEFGVVVTNSATYQEESYYLNHLSRDKIKHYLLASASLYPIMEKTMIDELPYMDGGYRNHIPINLALEKNPDYIIATDLHPEVDIKVPYNNDQILMIRPKWFLGDLMTFDINRNRRNLQLGYNDLKKAVGIYSGHLYTFVDDGSALREGLLEVIHQKTTDNNLINFVMENKDTLIKRLAREWGHYINEDNFHIALMEITARLFYISPYKARTVTQFNQQLHNRIVEFYNMDKNDALDQMKPEFYLGYKEWYDYFRRKLSILPEQERIFYFLDLLKEEKHKSSKVSYPFLLTIDPVPFTVALYIYYLSKNDKILIHTK